MACHAALHQTPGAGLQELQERREAQLLLQLEWWWGSGGWVEVFIQPAGYHLDIPELLKEGRLDVEMILEAPSTSLPLLGMQSVCKWLS